VRLFGFVSALVLTAGLHTASWANDDKLGNLTLTDAWVRASVPGQINGAGYLQINNAGNAEDKLVGVSSDAALRIELHSVVTEQGVAKMREVNSISIPANSMVKLAPGGYHIMFLQLTGPFKQDGTVPVTLKFEKAGEVRVGFQVKPSTYNPSANDAHGGHAHTPGMQH